MKSIIHVMCGLSLITWVTYSAEKKVDAVNKTVSIDEQKRRDAEAEKYRKLAESLGGKHLEQHAKHPNNKQAKL